MTLVFFIVFFNVYQGVREVSPTLIANARMLGADKRNLLRMSICPVQPAGSSPACTPVWVWPLLVPCGGVPGLSSRRWLSDSSGEGLFDVNTVFAGILVLTALPWCSMVW